MADSVKTTRTIDIECLFMDGDTRTIKLQNPKATIETSEITALNTLILNGGNSTSLLIGDRTGADFYRINTVTKITENVTTLDLNEIEE